MKSKIFFCAMLICSSVSAQPLFGDLNTVLIEMGEFYITLNDALIMTNILAIVALTYLIIFIYKGNMKLSSENVDLNFDPNEEPLNVFTGTDAKITSSANWQDTEKLLKQYRNIQAVNSSCVSVNSFIAGRSENQDYAIAFNVNLGSHRIRTQKRAVTVMAIADGLGGHPGGRAASFLVCKGILEAASSFAGQTKEPDTFIAHLRRGAEHTLKEFASKQAVNTCLSTCIIAVFDQDKYYMSWIGDGGCFLFRSELNEWSLPMIPQRGSSGALNDVGGALGASRLGSWSVSEEIRLPGDIFMIGSDGLTERVIPADFFQIPIQNMTQHKLPNVQIEMTAFLEYCIKEHPDHFDDNVSLIAHFSQPISLKAINDDC